MKTKILSVIFVAGFFAQTAECVPAGVKVARGLWGAAPVLFARGRPKGSATDETNRLFWYELRKSGRVTSPRASRVAKASKPSGRPRGRPRKTAFGPQPNQNPDPKSAVYALRKCVCGSGDIAHRGIWAAVSLAEKGLSPNQNCHEFLLLSFMCEPGVIDKFNGSVCSVRALIVCILQTTSLADRFTVLGVLNNPEVSAKGCVESALGAVKTELAGIEAGEASNNMNFCDCDEEKGIICEKHRKKATLLVRERVLEVVLGGCGNMPEPMEKL